MKTPGQKGAVGAWLTQTRKARGYKSGATARAEIERLTGWRISPSVYGEWESGSRVPSDENLARLEDFFGPMPRDVFEAPGDGGAVARLAVAQERTAAILDRQTDAIERQVAVLEQLVQAVREASAESSGSMAGLADSLGYMAGQLGLGLGQSGTESTTPRDRGGQGTAG